MGLLRCEHLYDYGSKSYCGLDDKDVTSQILSQCGYNWGNGCRKKYYIATVSNRIVKNGKTDSVLEGIRFLRDEYLEKDNKYEDLLAMYDYIGPQVARKIDEDENRELVATKVYSILARISRLVSKEEIDKATGYYSQMVGALINKYDLGEFYVETNNKIEIANKTVKKSKILTKTLD